MGAIKQQMIEEQERGLTETGSRPIVRVPEHGGDEMSNDFASQLDALIAQAEAGTPEEAPIPEVVEAPKEEPALETTPVNYTGSALQLAERAQEGRADQEMALERDFERQPASVPPEPEPEPAPVVVKETTAEKARRLELNKPLVGTISTEKMRHGDLILNDVCVKCVRCSLKLTDAVSVERGMGPECSSKGYAEDPKDPDEMGAMIELSAYPALVDFLTEHYKPLGVRGLMNGLVRIAALNRKSPVHGACANAIELLGYAKLAATLRDSLAMMTIRPSEGHPGHLHVHVRRREYTREWAHDCYRNVPHAFYDRVEKGLIVANRRETKGALWLAMIRHYPGECARTPSGTVRIPTMEEFRAQREAKKLAKTG